MTTSDLSVGGADLEAGGGVSGEDTADAPHNGGDGGGLRGQRQPRHGFSDLVAGYRQNLLLLVLAGNVFFWFRRGLPIGFSDGGLQTMLYHPGELLRAALFPWTDTQLGGVPTYANIAMVPIYLFGAALRAAHLPTWMVQALFWYLIEATGMLAVRAWLRRLLAGRPGRDAAATIGAVFYAFNMMTGLTYWFWDKLNITTIACVPLLLLAIEWSLTTTFRRASAAMAGAVFLAASLFLDGEFVGPVAVLCVVYLVVRVAQQRSPVTGRIALLARTGAAGAVALVANAWVLVPFLTTANSYYSAANVQINTAASVQNATNEATWSGLARFLPFGARAGGEWLYKTPGWRELYSSPIFWSIAVVILAVMVVGAVARSGGAGRFLLAGFAVGGLLLQAGAKGPLGPAVTFVVQHVPFGQALRTPWRDLAPVTLVGCAGLFGLGTVALSGSIVPHRRRWQGGVVAVLVAAACGVYAFPLWTGQIVAGPVTERGGQISSYVSVPPSYAVVAKFLDRHLGQGRVLALPLSPTSYLTTSWPSGYDGSDQRWLLFGGQRTISFTALGATPQTSLLSGFIDQSVPVDFTSLLQTAGSLSCRYVVVDSSVTTDRGGYYGQVLHTPQYYLAGLAGQGLNPVLSAGTLEVFAVPPVYVRPLAYAAPGDSGSVRAAVRHSSVSWTVRLDRGGRWTVVLGETASSAWDASVSVGGRVVHGHRVVVDGWANGWTFDLPHVTHPVTVDITYGPEGAYGIAAIVSLLAAVALLAAIAGPEAVRWRARRRRPRAGGTGAPWKPLAVAALAAVAVGTLLLELLAPDLLASPQRWKGTGGSAGLPVLATVSVPGGVIPPTSARSVERVLGGGTIALSGAGAAFRSTGATFVRTPPVTQWRPHLVDWHPGTQIMTISFRVPRASHYDLVFAGQTAPMRLAAAERTGLVSARFDGTPGARETVLELRLPVTVGASLVSLGAGIASTLGNCDVSAGGSVGQTIRGSVSNGGSPAAVLTLRSSEGVACVYDDVPPVPPGRFLLFSFSSKATRAGIPVACLYSKDVSQCLRRPTSSHPDRWVRRSMLIQPASPLSAVYFYAGGSAQPETVQFRDVSLETVQPPSSLLGVLATP